jgi:hypothetical protein
MMNLYEAQKYTAQRQGEARESARVWRLARELGRQPQDRIGALVPNQLSIQQQLVGGCESGPSARRSRPTTQ